MKRTALYLSIIFCLAACEGKVVDQEQELKELSQYWANQYVNYALSHVIDIGLTETHVEDDMQWVNTTQLKDTLFLVFRDEYIAEDGDSVNVTTTLLQIKDSIVVKTDGYRYSRRSNIHLFTVGPGIVNYEGKFHIDFCVHGRTIPWGWGEVTYSKTKDDTDDLPYSRVTEVGWY